MGICPEFDFVASIEWTVTFNSISNVYRLLKKLSEQAAFEWHRRHSVRMRCPKDALFDCLTKPWMYNR